MILHAIIQSLAKSTSWTGFSFVYIRHADIAHLYEAGIQDCACTIWKKFGVSIA